MSGQVEGLNGAGRLQHGPDGQKQGTEIAGIVETVLEAVVEAESLLRRKPLNKTPWSVSKRSEDLFQVAADDLYLAVGEHGSNQPNYLLVGRIGVAVAEGERVIGQVGGRAGSIEPFEKFLYVHSFKLAAERPMDIEKDGRKVEYHKQPTDTTGKGGRA